MKTCCCMLAGTKACDSCQNGTSQTLTTFVPTKKNNLTKYIKKDFQIK